MNGKGMNNESTYTLYHTLGASLALPLFIPSNLNSPLELGMLEWAAIIWWVWTGCNGTLSWLRRNRTWLLSAPASGQERVGLADSLSVWTWLCKVLVWCRVHWADGSDIVLELTTAGHSGHCLRDERPTIVDSLCWFSRHVWWRREERREETDEHHDTFTPIELIISVSSVFNCYFCWLSVLVIREYIRRTGRHGQTHRIHMFVLAAPVFRWSDLKIPHVPTSSAIC